MQQPGWKDKDVGFLDLRGIKGIGIHHIIGVKIGAEQHSGRVNFWVIRGIKNKAIAHWLMLVCGMISEVDILLGPDIL